MLSMVKRAGLILAVATAAVLTTQAADRRPMTFDDIMAMRAVGSPEISPDGSAVLYTVREWEAAKESGSKDAPQNDAADQAGQKDAAKPLPRMESRTHIYRVPAAGGAAQQITFGERGESNPRWSPDGKYISFTAARGGPGGGSEGGEDGPRPQIWIMPTDGGEPWQLTTAKEGVSTYAWAPDSRTIAFTSREPLSKADEAKRKRRDDARVFEGDFRMAGLSAADVATKKERTIVEPDAFTVRGEPSWSPDSASIAFAAAPTPMVRDERDDLYIVPAAGGTAQKLTSNLGPDRSPSWSPDGKTIAYTSESTGKPNGDGLPNALVMNAHLTLYDVASRSVRDVSSPSFDLSPGGELTWSADSGRLYLASGVRTANDVFTYDLAANRYSRITNGRLIRSLSRSHDGKRVAFVDESVSTPAEIYVADASFGSPVRLTDTNPHVKDVALGETDVTTWESTDGADVEGVLLKPVGYVAGKRYPLLVVVHGGPTGAFTNGFRLGLEGGQVWAGEGWAVLYPNPRGSTNYGEKFMQANIPDWGGGDYRDIMAGVDAAITRGIADPGRLAVMGWSYGGYMTCWIVSQTGRFRAAMMGAGLSNLVSMYGTNDIPNYLSTFFNGVPGKDTLALYRERSGLTYADRVTTPLLILHGASDDRVPIGQPMEFYRALKDRGKTVELVFYPREGHGFQEYYHLLDRMKRQHEWITKYTLVDDKRKTTSP